MIGSHKKRAKNDTVLAYRAFLATKQMPACAATQTGGNGLIRMAVFALVKAGHLFGSYD